MTQVSESVQTERTTETDRPLVSIVTAVRNARGTMGRAMASVMAQSYQPIEYIVIDGGSTDGTLDIIRSREASIAYWVSEPDGGISDAFNKGIARARGEWIGILNADDWYEPKAVAKVLASAGHASLVHGQMRVWEGDRPLEVVTPHQDLLRRDMTINHPSCFVRREMYERYGLFDTRYVYAMDYEWLLRLRRAGEPFRQIDEILVNMASGGISDVGWKRACAEVRQAKMQNGARGFSAWSYYGWQLLRRRMRVILERLGLKVIVAGYRARYSPTRKERI
jgi:glycosyltransferase involved in cell wall biosynthesis